MATIKKIEKGLRKMKPRLRKARKFARKIHMGIDDYFALDREEALKMKPDAREIRF